MSDLTSRATRLVRVADLSAFRTALVALATGGHPLEARDRLVIVPTRAAGAHLRRAIEDTLLDTRRAVVLPDLVTPSNLVARLGERLPPGLPLITDAEREVLLGVACRAVRAGGLEPPFRLRPALVAEMLRFYDALRRHQHDVDAFERHALSVLEPGAVEDRGAERLVRQTRFLAAAFRALERRIESAGLLDEHRLRARLVSTPAPRPCREVIVAVGDRRFDPHGLAAAEWDLLTRVPGLHRLDVVITDTALAGACHERLHHLLPRVEEIRWGDDAPARLPVLRTAAGDSTVQVARDREEEIAAFARHVKRMWRAGELPALDRAALVVRQPLPYVYLAREVLRSGGMPCQLFDALPLAAEPFAVALDVVMTTVTSGFARDAVVELLRSPHIRLPAVQDAGGTVSDRAGPPSKRDVAALDRALAEDGFSGGLESLAALVERWQTMGREPGRRVRATRAGIALLTRLRDLAPLAADAPAADHLAGLLAVLSGWEQPPQVDEPLRVRHLRARGAVLGTLTALGDAHARFDPVPVRFEDTAHLVRRWIEAQTFAPHTGAGGVHVVDAVAARFGAFSDVQLAGLVEGEWPERPRRSIFYAPSILALLGWPSHADRRDGARAEFLDLLRLPSRQLTLSTFALEADALTSPSPLLDELAPLELERMPDAADPVRIFDYEALADDPADLRGLTEDARAWAEARLALRGDTRARGVTAGAAPDGWSVSAIERYQDCPFRFFAADVLRLEAPHREADAAPLVRGRFLHDVFQRFFEAWDAAGGRAIVPDRLDDARALFVAVAERMLERLPAPDRMLERARLFGSAVAPGIVDVLLGLEAARQGDVRARLLEHRFEGAFSLGDASRRPVRLTGVADRIDVLSDRRLRVIDYKSGQAPSVQRALQVPIYALCAQEQLAGRDGAAWEVAEAAYVGVGGRRPVATVVAPGAAGGDRALAEARDRLFAALDGIAGGAFPVQPFDPRICRHCAYPAVCRKDYVGDA